MDLQKILTVMLNVWYRIHYICKRTKMYYCELFVNNSRIKYFDSVAERCIFATEIKRIEYGKVCKNMHSVYHAFVYG